MQPSLIENKDLQTMDLKFIHDYIFNDENMMCTFIFFE